MKRFLFISHDATRTGAPIILRDLIRWIKEREPSVEIDILLREGGEIASDFAELGETAVLGPPRVMSRTERIKERLLGPSDSLKSPAFTGRRYDAVLGNTVITLPLLEHFRGLGERTICWMHELEFVIKQAIGLDEFKRLASQAVEFFIVPSAAVASLLDELEIAVPRICVSDFSLPQEAPVQPLDLSRYGISAGNVVVGGAGTVEWRKGVDLFAQASQIVAKTRGDIRFVWIGTRLSGSTDDRLEHDLARMPQESLPIFIDSTPEFRSIIAAFDIFALSSRADASPVVVHEAARLGKPIICFDKSGGIPEFVGDDAGIVVPYADVAAFAAAVVSLSDDGAGRAAMGEAALRKVQTTHSAERSCSAIYELLSR